MLTSITISAAGDGSRDPEPIERRYRHAAGWIVVRKGSYFRLHKPSCLQNHPNDQRQHLHLSSYHGDCKFSFSSLEFEAVSIAKILEHHTC